MTKVILDISMSLDGLPRRSTRMLWLAGQTVRRS